MRSTSPAVTTLLCALLASACGDEAPPGAPDAATVTIDAAVDAGPSPTFAPGESPYGRTMSEWAAAWWTWTFHLPRTDHPIAGGPCAAGQTGDVFFVAGNFGGTETRTCTVPAGKALFFPILNSLCWPGPEKKGCDTYLTTADLTACAARIFDEGPARTMAVTLDGAPLTDLEAYRASTGRFSWPPPPFPASEWVAPLLGRIEANACGIPEGDRFGVSDGFWLMLRPLPPGAHVLRIAGRIAGAIDLDVTYQLTQQ